jgi:5-(carboxyamino)imidazole ribonucleotide synthase
MIKTGMIKTGMIKTVGILGAGQLARMLAQAGQPMGLDFIFLDPARDACAAEFGEHLCAGWDDEAALRELGRRADVVTFDFENVPESSASLIESLCPVYPPPRALFESQDRLREKTMMADLGIPVAPFYPVSSRPDLLAAVAAIGLPCVLKTRRLGYDGKGQAVLRFQEDMERAWQALGDSELVCEGFVSFQAECSIIAARDRHGRTVYWPLTRNLHRGGILVISTAPAYDAALQARAEALILKLLDHLDYTGVMALELFLADGELLANEFAPRVHNSGHWSIEGARTSQFENHLRAICGLPLAETENLFKALMFNLLGEMPAFVSQPSADTAVIPGLHWHDYHKTPREGRKIGHVTLTATSDAALRARAAQLAAALGVAAELSLKAILAETGA